MPLDDDAIKSLLREASAAPILKWWQRGVLIVAANAVGVLLGGGLLAYQGILWTKSNATDDLQDELNTHVVTSTTSTEEILDEIAIIKAQLQNIKSSEGQTTTPYMPPPDAAPPAGEPSALQVREAKEKINQRMDKAIYRAQKKAAN